MSGERSINVLGRSRRSCIAAVLAALVACLTAESRLAAGPPADDDAGDSCAELLGLMYWTSFGDGVSDGIYRACRDGSEVKQLVSMKRVDGLAVDEAGGKLYFTVTAPRANGDAVYRANLDGSKVEELIQGLNYTGDLTIDAEAGKLYVSCMGAGKIVEAKLDGTEPKDLIVGQGNPDELTIDPVGRKIYWVRSGMIRRADLDGSNIEDVVPIRAMTMGLAIDSEDQRLYYVVTGAGSIRRVKFDGTGDEQLVGNHFNTDGLALDPYNRKLYWTEESKLCQANLDGTLVETLVPDKTRKYGSIVVLPPTDAE